MQPVFRRLTSHDLAALIGKATARVVVVAPGVDKAVSDALVAAVERIGAAGVHIVLDVDEANCRVGYGSVEGYELLARAGVVIRKGPGLRIGIIVVDEEEGYLFAVSPLMVESPDSLQRGANAVRATPDQLRALLAAVLPTRQLALGFSDDASPRTADGCEVGRDVVRVEEVQQIRERVEANPIQDFDLARVVHVFNARIEFVELSVEGAKLEHHRVALPKDLLTIVRDKDTRERLTAGFKMVSDSSKLTGDRVTDKANEIRRQFIRTHPIYGGIVLKSKRKKLEESIEELRLCLEQHKTEVRQKFAKEAEKSKRELVGAFWRAVRTSPPPDLLARIDADKPNTEEAKSYLEGLLDAAFPNVEQLCARMKVVFVTKDVTWSTLNSVDFVDWLQEQYRFSQDMKKPFEDYSAAKQRFKQGGEPQ